MTNNSFDDSMQISKMLSNIKILQVISLAVMSIGLLVFIGWVFDIAALKSIIPNAVTMKFSTAISFVFSGLILYFVVERHYGKIGLGQIIIPICGFSIFLFMATMLVTSVLGISVQMEQLFIKERHDAIQTLAPGIPSLVTTFDFILIVAVGILSLSGSTKIKYVPYFGRVILATGAIALIGYLVKQPFLYYYFENISTAMAIHTSILFVLSGIVLSWLKVPKRSTYTPMKIQTKITTLFLASSLIPIIFIVGLSSTTADNFQPMQSYGIVIVSVITAISVGIFSLLTSRGISQPIIELKNISTRISHGDFSIRASQNTGDEIGELSESFNQMVDDVIRAERLSTIGLLASRLGHDIRGNLSAILGVTELIKMKRGDAIDKELKGQLEIIQRSAYRIQSQIEDVLNFVRFSPLKSEQVRLSKILHETLKVIQVPQRIKIVLPENDISINCNQNQFEIVLTNLISNSLQAIENEGEITIKAHEDGNNSIIEVKDSGSGIPSDIVSKIFEPLFTTKQKGTGLGLATCKNIIESHHGTIDVKNNPTTFTIRIPK